MATTSFQAGGYSGRPYGSFAGRVPYVVPTAQQLAELYGGNIFTARKRKKKEEEKPSLEGMIEAIIAVEEHGKEEIAELLPKKQQAALPEPDLATLEQVVRQVKAAGEKTVAKIEALYEEVMDEDDAAALALLFDMDVADDRLRRKPKQERLQ